MELTEVEKDCHLGITHEEIQQLKEKNSRNPEFRVKTEVRPMDWRKKNPTDQRMQKYWAKVMSKELKWRGP